MEKDKIMRLLFNYLTIITGILMTISILLQARGASLGAGFGGGDSATYTTRRGPEKVLYNATIILGIIFVMSVILGVLAKR